MPRTFIQSNLIMASRNELWAEYKSLGLTGIVWKQATITNLSAAIEEHKASVGIRQIENEPTSDTQRPTTDNLQLTTEAIAPKKPCCVCKETEEQLNMVVISNVEVIAEDNRGGGRVEGLAGDSVAVRFIHPEVEPIQVEVEPQGVCCDVNAWGVSVWIEPIHPMMGWAYVADTYNKKFSINPRRAAFPLGFNPNADWLPEEKVTTDIVAIAQAELEAYIEEKAEEIAPELPATRLEAYLTPKTGQYVVLSYSPEYLFPKRYLVTDFGDDLLGCTCPAHIYHSAHKYNCKHVKHVKANPPTKREPVQLDQMTFPPAPYNPTYKVYCGSQYLGLLTADYLGGWSCGESPNRYATAQLAANAAADRWFANEQMVQRHRQVVMA